MKKLIEVYRENTGWMMSVKISNPLSPYNGDILTSIFSNNTNMTYVQAKKMASEIIED